MMQAANRRARGARWCAAHSVGLSTILFSLLALPYALSRVGLEYDEALHQVGAVETIALGRSAASGDSWITLLGFPVKLMVVPYTGAVKDLLLLVPFELFGTDPAVGRLLAVALAALGIYGLGRLVFDQLGAVFGGLCALVLAVNPAYLDQVVFDNGPVAVWMAGIGLCSLALNRMLSRPSRGNALLLGITIGILVWIKLNAVWLLASLVVAVAIMLGRSIGRALRTDRSRSISYAALAGAGALLGMLPFLVYQVQSGWRSFQLDYLPKEDVTAVVVQARLRAIPDALLSDAEHRSIWHGGLQGPLLRTGLIPLWQQAFVAGVIATAFALAFVLRDRGAPDSLRQLRWARIAAITVTVFTLQMLTTQYVINQHHLVVLLCVVAWVCAARRHLAWKRLGLGVLVLYLALAGFWNVVSIRHLSDTGGRGYWSGAIDCTARFVEQRDGGRQIQVLDWGLRTGISVLNEARPAMAETWVPELLSPELSARGTSWDDDLRSGGMYLLSAGASHYNDAPGRAFLAALRRRVATDAGEFVAVGFRDELGAPATIAVEVPAPNTDRNRFRARVERAAARSHSDGCSTPVVIDDVDELDAFFSGRTGRRSPSS